MSQISGVDGSLGMAVDFTLRFGEMLWLCKGFGFAGAWTVREQNRLLSVCFGLPAADKA